MAKKSSQRVVLGNVARDPISGFQGTASHLSELLNGTVQFSLQPKCKMLDAGVFPDAYNFDTHLLEYVGPGLVDKVTPPPVNVHVSLGDRVRDDVTKITGIATGKVTFINGCVYFHVQPPAADDKANELPKSIFLAFDRLTILEKFAFKAVVPSEPAPVAAVVDRPPTGGPTTRSERQT